MSLRRRLPCEWMCGQEAPCWRPGQSWLARLLQPFCIYLQPQVLNACRYKVASSLPLDPRSGSASGTVLLPPNLV